ncbi:MAG TPA: Clp protease N-terminal domain-containing protein [Pseudonocardiaceae bacterium]|jgi:ATP-dependent Clp protease ATP-binding subunit ClpC|nr:Clp protease N-terminal domain-containing protein [Pseudonocardiaceae bacterium]
MFERFTDSARNIVVLAQDEARGLRHGWIGTEHLLLALFRSGADGHDPVLAELLAEPSIEQVRAEVVDATPAGSDDPSGHIPFTTPAKLVLERSLRESQRLASEHISAAHLLLGLLTVTEGGGVRALIALKVDLTALRERAEELASAEQTAVPAHRPRATRLGGRGELPARMELLEEQVKQLAAEVARLRAKLDDAS